MKALVIIENRLRERRRGQKDVWTAKKGEAGVVMINLFIYINEET